MADTIFHVTNTLHLPWLVESGELRPHTNELAGIGRVTFLWATSNPHGDRTAGAMISADYHQAGWHEDLFRLVRLTLPGDAFLPWCQIVEMSNWTPAEVAKLVALDHRKFGEYGHEHWRCRHDPLPLDRVLKAECRAYGGRWRPIDLDPARVVHTANDDCKGYRINRRVIHYACRRVFDHPGFKHYDYAPLHLDSDDMAELHYANQDEEE